MALRIDALPNPIGQVPGRDRAIKRVIGRRMKVSILIRLRRERFSELIDFLPQLHQHVVRTR